MPFDSRTPYAATFHHHRDSELTFVKGAPEEVLGMCEVGLGGESLNATEVHAVAQSMAEQGLRVLGFAYREAKKQPQPAEIPEHREGLTFLGLQGMIDAPRDEVKDFIRTCEEAGVRVGMITGDHATTAAAIGRQLGITSGVITGRDIDPHVCGRAATGC